MRRWLALVVLSLWLGLPALLAAAEGEWLTFTVDGAERRVLLYPPALRTAGTPPLLLVFHGRGDDAAAFAAAVKLHEDWPEAVVAYPRGELHENRPQRGWQYRAGQYADRDLKLTDAVLETLVDRFGSAPGQRFVAGFSNGGHFVFLLMRERPQHFAARAVLGSVAPAFASDAEPKPLLYLFGRFEDRRYQDDWRATVEALVRHQRSQGPLQPALGCCQRQGGMDGAEFVFGLYNAGHIWPSGGNAWLREFFSAATTEPGPTADDSPTGSAADSPSDLPNEPARD